VKPVVTHQTYWLATQVNVVNANTKLVRTVLTREPSVLLVLVCAKQLFRQATALGGTKTSLFRGSIMICRAMFNSWCEPRLRNAWGLVSGVSILGVQLGFLYSSEVAAPWTGAAATYTKYQHVLKGADLQSVWREIIVSAAFLQSVADLSNRSSQQAKLL